MKWFKKTYFFVFFMTLFYVVSSSHGIFTNVAAEMVLASEYVTDVNAKLAKTKVYAGGDVIGIKLYTDGIMVVELASFEDEQGNIVCPAKDSGIQVGDIILAANGKKMESNNQLINSIRYLVDKSVKLSIKRGEERFDVDVFPKKTFENREPKLGLWVRDSAAGIGTMTFVTADDKKFFALGHGITDKDIRERYTVRQGTIEFADVMNVEKSKEGVPGEIQATFGGNNTTIGSVEGNTKCGIHGSYNAELLGQPMEIASRWQIKEGPATILCSVDGKEKKEYSVNINKIILGGGFSEKSMVIEVTDPELIKKTGGIVQGMSGSPILQNGRIVGAVTHVFVNDPTRGYGIFIENMLAEAEKIK